MKPEDKAKEICRVYADLKSARSVWESHWQEIAEFVLPRRNQFNKKEVEGSKNMQRVYDSTPIWANEQLASALNGMLTNPAIKWFNLKTKIRELMQLHEVNVWLEAVEDIIRDVFATPEANFNSQSHELYLDLGAFGTGIMFIEETPGEGAGLRYVSQYLGDCMFEQGKSGLVDTVYRTIEMTVRVAYQRWGQAIGADLLKKLEKTPYQKVQIMHKVCPRTDRDYTKDDGPNKPFASYYLYVDKKHMISEGGFDYFPYVVPRFFKVTGETYGRSPAMTALPDIKMLNQMSKTTIRAAQKKVDPPMQMPDDGFVSPIRTTPSGINYFRSGLGKDDRISPIDTGGDIGLGLEMINQVRQQILQIFYIDKLSLQKDKVEMTRAEAEIRHMENLRQMSPFLGRCETEFTDPLIETTFMILYKQGRLPIPPEVLLENEADLEIEYISPMVRAQKSSEALGIQQTIELIAPISQAKPELLDNYDWDEIARSTPQWFALPAKLILPKKQVDEIRKQRAAQTAAQVARDESVIAADNQLKLAQASAA